MGGSHPFLDLRRNNKYPITESFSGYFDGGCFHYFNPHPIWPGLGTRRLLVEHPSCPHIGDFPKVWT